MSSGRSQVHWKNRKAEEPVSETALPSGDQLIELKETCLTLASCITANDTGDYSTIDNCVYGKGSRNPFVPFENNIVVSHRMYAVVSQLTTHKLRFR